MDVTKSIEFPPRVLKSIDDIEFLHSLECQLISSQEKIENLERTVSTLVKKIQKLSDENIQIYRMKMIQIYRMKKDQKLSEKTNDFN